MMHPSRKSAVWLGVLLLALTGLINGLGRPSARTAPTQATTNLQFSQATYSVAEGAGSTTITVTRTGDLSSAVSVDYTTSDSSEVTQSEAEGVAKCAATTGTALSKCDFNTALGRLSFASGETSKTFSILLTDDSYTEGTETAPLTLSNPTNGAVLGAQSTATLQITDGAETSTNLISDARAFVRQQYHDFLNREPDGPGWDFWTQNITQCGSNAQCVDKQRVTTSAAFFLSPEHQYTGFFVYRMYKGGLGRTPTFPEFMRDAQSVGNGIIVSNQLSGAVIEANKASFASQFIQKAEFKALYDGLTNQQYVDKLFQTTGVNASASDRTALVNGLNAGSETRASVLQKVVDGVRVIAEGNQEFTTTYGKAFYDAEFNNAFVQMEYFGYMRREPDAPGYAFWLGKLNLYGNYIDAEMVRSFIVSPEYRSRFGPLQSQTANQPPVVNAGPDQTITLPANTVNLSGTATDDGLPLGATLSVSWSMVSGPASVTFGNASAAATTATFSVAGTYVLRLTANDTQLVSSDDVTVTVNAAGTVSLTPEQRVATTQAVSAKFESLSNSNLDQNAVNQELLNFIRSRPEFAQSGITESSCVWATYIDGVELIVVNHRDLLKDSTETGAVSDLTASSISEPRPQMGNFPNSDRARLIYAMPGWRDSVTGFISPWLQEQGYDTFAGASDVEGLKRVGGDGVFYYRGHGGTSNGKNPYAISTTTPVTLGLDVGMSDDLIPQPGPGLNQRLVHMLVFDGKSGDKFTTGEYYGITDQFINDYWLPFSPNSFVYIDAPGSTRLLSAINIKRASVLAGWFSLMGWKTASETAKFVFDRLLGGNRVYKESGFKQRPFDYPSVEQDLAKHAVEGVSVTHVLGWEPNTGAELQFIRLFEGNGNFRLLAPSIARMYVDEDKSELIIEGIFGDNPGDDGKVTVNGQPIAHTAWTDDEIRCNLPLLGPQSSGDVMVEVRGHKSNVAQLTEWEGDFVFSINTNVGTHQQQGTIHARFRADAREWRPVIHNPPVLRTNDATFTATLDSYMEYSCSGSSTFTFSGFTETVIWSGAGRSPRLTDDIASSGNFIFPIGQFVNSLRMDVLFTYTATDVCKEITIDNSGSQQDDVSLLNFQHYLYPQDHPDTKIFLDTGYAILLGSESHTVGSFPVRVAGGVDTSGIVRLRWNRIEPKHPPDPNSAR